MGDTAKRQSPVRRRRDKGPGLLSADDTGARDGADILPSSFVLSRYLPLARRARPKPLQPLNQGDQESLGAGIFLPRQVQPFNQLLLPKDQAFGVCPAAVVFVERAFHGRNPSS